MKTLTLDRLSSHYDAIVAGGRVAGASTALLLARGGMRVLLIDPRPPERDTLSTHALMRGAVVQLRRWGLLDAVVESGASRIESTIFDYTGERVEVEIRDRDGVDALYAPRRTVLDPILVDAARQAGVEVAHGLRLTDLLTAPDGRIRGARVADASKRAVDVVADLVVGADGRSSRVARLSRARTERVGRFATATVYAYVPSTASECSAYTWGFAPVREGERGPAVSMGIIPTTGGTSCVFASMTPAVFGLAGRAGMPELWLSTIERMAPELAERLRARPLPRLRGFAGMRGILRAPAGPGWALVGDAGHFRDPATAHGISDALRDAEGLARAALDGSPAAWSRFHHERNDDSVPLFEITDRIAALDWDHTTVQELHHELSRAMNRGVERIRGWESEAAALSATAPG